MLYNNELSQTESASIEWYTLLLDIRTQIIDYLPVELWEWFAIHDNEFYEYSLKYRNYYINKYTVRNMVGNYETWKILRKLHREPINGVSIPAIIRNEKKWYYINGKLHRNPDKDGNDLPAIESEKKAKYYQYGIKHRNPDKYGIVYPTIIKSRYVYPTVPMPLNEDESQTNEHSFKYYVNGQLHRDDVGGIPKPAVIHTMNSKYEYFQNGAYYRSDGGPVLIANDDYEFWLLNIRDDYIQVINNYVFINAPNKYVGTFEDLDTDTVWFLWFINILLAFITILSL